MVLVFPWIVYILYRGSNWYVQEYKKRIERESNGNHGRPMNKCKYQEIFSKLSVVGTLSELARVSTEALKVLFAECEDAIVYICDPSNHDWLTSTGVTSAPQTESIRAALLQKTRIVTTLSNSTQEYVIVSPILQDCQVLALSVIKCSAILSDIEETNLNNLEKQIALCYKKLTNTKHTESEKILNLCAELHHKDATSLQVKIINYLLEQTDAETGFLLLTGTDGTDLFCQVIGEKIVPGEKQYMGEYGAFLSVLDSKQTMFSQQMSQPQIQDVATFLGMEVNSLMCYPVINGVSGDVVTLAVLVNKRNNRQFDQSDFNSVENCFKYMGSLMASTVAFLNERRLKNQTEALLQVAKNLFRHIGNLTTLLQEIMQEARNLTKAERCSVFLLEDDELVAKVFDGTDTGDSQAEVRIPKHQGIAGHVVTTGKMLNIKDAYSHPLFYRGVDESTGFRTRNILCFPIMDENEVIVGIAQLCNKIGGVGFSTFDEELAKAFSIYCCISIVHSLLYMKVISAQQRSQLSNELMLHYMKVPLEEVKHLSECSITLPQAFAKDMDRFSCVPRNIPDHDTPLACVSMFEDQGFISRWRIKRDTLARFILMAKKGYRDPPYHNWSHAFAVAHFCYLLNKNLHLNKYLNDIEVFSLFVACICHDIDHRGTNNSFQMASKSVLAALYSSEGSVLERHHIAQTMCILNTEGCNIFENLTRKEYQQVLDLIRDIILATDLAHHLDILDDLKLMAIAGYDKEDYKCRSLLLSLLMTSCDLSDQTKNWDNSKQIAKSIYKEFFSQGDAEKAIGQKPVEMMDRERACIPELQLGFLDHIALPVYQILADLFPECDVVLETVKSCRSKWELVGNRMKEHQEKYGDHSLDVFEVEVDVHITNGDSSN